MQRIVPYLFVAFLTLPLSVFSASLNAGFVQGLWYADEQVFADEPTRIYVAFRNNTADDLTGTVLFSVDGVGVGSSDVRVLSGRVVEAWVDWTPTYGERAIAATVENVVLHQMDGKTVPAEISELSAKDMLSIDRDTDKDGTGDKKDADDDNDGVSDEDEKKRGTDPRVVDRQQEDDAEEKTVPTQSATVHSAASTQGFEQYLGDGSAHTLLGGITSRVNEAKQSIDAYRDARSAGMEDNLLPTDQTSGNATITRSIEESGGGLLQMLVRGGKALMEHLWTFILWLISNIFAHPALVQFLLLFGILYGLFKFTRRFVRRPGF